ncbi:hypothetical protein M422DRAFT_265266 [Sphaerobolus stellatus SS14]|uniref:Uncharacterized protein n=1 Tax=Sphaerobolus stellatus (strain SS14) TaxID=990650 RepID=A0A0C9V636_SPHS4|nr:hypothetical protein M422DRAFT_265266 [Sphaerobolus stellatus SS14]
MFLVSHRNIEEERLKSRERTKQVATRAREKALEEALKAAKKAERIRRKVAKSVQKVAGHYTTSSKPKQGGSTDQVFLYSRKTDLQMELDAIWERLFYTKTPKWDTYFEERYLQVVNGAHADGLDDWRERVSQHVVAFQEAMKCINAIITEAQSRTYTVNGSRLIKAQEFLEIPQQYRGWLLHSLYCDEEFIFLVKDKDGFVKYEEYHKLGYLCWQ